MGGKDITETVDVKGKLTVNPGVPSIQTGGSRNSGISISFSYPEDTLGPTVGVQFLQFINHSFTTKADVTLKAPEVKEGDVLPFSTVREGGTAPNWYEKKNTKLLQLMGSPLDHLDTIPGRPGYPFYNGVTKSEEKGGKRIFAMWDSPDLMIQRGFRNLKREFIVGTTYLVLNKKIVFVIQWERSQVGNDGNWGAGGYKILKEEATDGLLPQHNTPTLFLGYNHTLSGDQKEATLGKPIYHGDPNPFYRKP